jgi:hypothetical protein
MRGSSLVRRTVAILAVAAGYYGAAKLGLALAYGNRSVTAVWPPTGIALAALVPPPPGRGGRGDRPSPRRPAPRRPGLGRGR